MKTIISIIITVTIFFYWHTPTQAQGPPRLEVTMTTTQTAQGHLFTAPLAQGGVGQYKIMIVDNSGNVVMDELKPAWILDFKVLTPSTLSYFDTARGEFVLMNELFQEVGVCQ